MNIEGLLGKLLQETMGSGGSQFSTGHGYNKGSYKKKKHKPQSLKDSLVNNLTSQLTSGKGLMTALGLGVGAYEIFRTSGQRESQPQPTPQQTAWNTAQQQPSMGGSPPPPPPPPSSFTQAPVQAAPPMPAQAEPAVQAKQDDQTLALRLIRVMVAAAHADGTLDAEEEKAILDRMRAADISQEEKIFLLDELHHPRPIAELTQGINDLRLAQAMYAVALSAIEVDTDSERQWLDELGSALNLSSEIRRFIEETC